MAKKKKNKEKVIYYDDGSTISDMSSVNRQGVKKDPPPPKYKSTFSDKWKTYWSAVKSMLMPLCYALFILGILYIIMMLLVGGF